MEEHRRGEASDGHKRECAALVQATKRYGWAAMRVEVLMEGLSKAELDACEKRLIAEHGTLSPAGYNIMKGGSADPWLNPELGARMRAQKQTEEYRAKQRARWTEDVRAEYGERNRQRHALDGGKRIREIAADARTKCKTPEALAKMRATCAAKRDAALALLSPKEAARKRRKAEMDSARHARRMAHRSC